MAWKTGAAGVAGLDPQAFLSLAVAEGGAPREMLFLGRYIEAGAVDGMAKKREQGGDG